MTDKFQTDDNTDCPVVIYQVNEPNFGTNQLDTNITAEYTYANVNSKVVAWKEDETGYFMSQSKISIEGFYKLEQNLIPNQVTSPSINVNVQSNWFGIFQVKGWTNSKWNFANSKEKVSPPDFILTMDVCGHEEIIEPEIHPDQPQRFVNNQAIGLDYKFKKIIPYNETYFITEGVTRTTVEFSNYTTTSGPWPSWHKDYLQSKHCDIAKYQVFSETDQNQGTELLEPSVFKENLQVELGN